MITYREITIEEIHQHILEVDVSEHGELIYLWQDGELITYNHWSGIVPRVPLKPGRRTGPVYYPYRVSKPGEPLRTR